MLAHCRLGWIAGQQTIEHLLSQLSLPQPLDLEGDEVDPQFSRGLLRHGWLSDQLAPQAWPEVSAVEQAVHNLETKRPTIAEAVQQAIEQQAMRLAPFPAKAAG